MRFILPLLAIASVFTLQSCKDTKKIKNQAFIGGEIVNPSNNLVIFIKNNTILDTLKLDRNNRFKYRISDLEKGLYTFYHGGEVQFVLLEPQDSLMLRLNTMEFDESLVFTGKGAKKNNYLINTYLTDELEEKAIISLSQLPADEFSSKLDSMRTLKRKKLNAFKEKIGTTKLFNTIAEANINYNYYLHKEAYPFMHSGNKVKNIESLPEDFYDYRTNIDYNHCDLSQYHVYYSFLRQHFKNLALQKQAKHTRINYYNPYSLTFNLNRLDIIDSLITEEGIKNELLTRTFRTFINSSKNVKDNGLLLEKYLQKVTNEDFKAEAKREVKALNSLKIGSNLPEIEIVTTDNIITNLDAEAKHKPTLIYFWSYTIRRHFKESHSKIRELKKRYPNLNVIAININNGSQKQWVQSLREYNLPETNEYKFKSPIIAKHKLAFNAINKVMLVNKKGKIVDDNANMFSVTFESKLDNLLR